MKVLLGFARFGTVDRLGEPTMGSLRVAQEVIGMNRPSQSDRTPACFAAFDRTLLVTPGLTTVGARSY